MIRIVGVFFYVSVRVFCVFTDVRGGHIGRISIDTLSEDVVLRCNTHYLLQLQGGVLSPVTLTKSHTSPN